MNIIDHQTLKKTLNLAWPISLQSVLTSSLSMIDIVMISHLGDSAVAAVGLANRFQFVVAVILLGIAWTVGVLSAQHYGANKPERIRATIARACILANVALAFIIFFIAFWGHLVMALGSTNSEVIELGKHYLWIVMPSLSFMAIILILENAIRGLGEVKVPMALSAIAILVNIILNYWLINGGLGIPALGVVGAAIATALARLLHLALFIAMLISRSHLLRVRRSDLTGLLEVKAIKHFLNLAVPMMISFGVWSSGTFVYQIIFGRMGTRELAVMSILTPIEGVVLALFFGLASACSITVGQHLGANRFDDAWLHARAFSILNPAIGFLFGLLLLLMKDVILLPYADLPSETLAMAENVFILISLIIWIKVINMTLAMGILRAGGDNQVCMYIDIIGMWIVSIPLTIFVAFYLQWPLFWVVLTAFSEEVCKAVLFIGRVLQKRWLLNLAEKEDALSVTPSTTDQHS